MNKDENRDDSAHGTQPPGGATPSGDARADGAEGPAPDTEQRPLGALAVMIVLMVSILGLWFGMYFLNLVRS